MEKQFLENRNRMSLREILALEPTHRADSLILKIVQEIAQKEERKGFSSVSKTERIVLSIETFSSLAFCDGFDACFRYEAKLIANNIVESLKTIGCPQTSLIIKKAIDSFSLPPNSPPEKYEEIM
ncbi:MAG: hypothetical protein HQM08_24970 [Candidatus Riflebacteria bacterium]|nr:hypothetical protein [Candidatus Riflebacteria bacterium]